MAERADEAVVEAVAGTVESGFETLPVRRWRGGQFSAATDAVVQEVPAALVYNGLSHAVMMVTPTDLEAFALGFSLSEGLIAGPQELYALDVQQTPAGAQIDLEISARAFATLKGRRRALAGRTGCGLCGIESLTEFQQEMPRVTTPARPGWLQDIPGAMARLATRQPISRMTGGAHAAAWVVDGDIVALFEDVGRHNALDKLLGHLARQRCDVSAGFVAMTSRASYELIRKCARFNIGLLASISAPTTLAVRLAQEAGLTLASFCRDNGFVVYTGTVT